MKLSINKSAKRVLSITLACVMLLGTLFTANIGVNITAGAQTPIAEGTIDLLEFGSYLTNAGSASQYWDTVVADNGETGASWDDPIIIDSAEELVYICKSSGNTTKGKYYKVADGLAGFDLSKGDIDLEGTLADNIDKIKAGGKNHAGSTGNSFQGYFDGNGATVYGAWTNHNSLSAYVGLFSCTYGDVIIKNINVNKASFTGSAAAGGIVGYHKADDATSKLIIENCSVTDSHLEATAAAKGYGTGVGAIIGYGASAPSWKESEKGVDGNNDGDMVDTIYENVPYIIKNCYVNLDENYFISIAEDGTEASGERTCHGGVAGVLGSNALAVSNCVVIGITPYATSESSAYNDIQHSGLASHFTNVYTDQATGSIEINNNTNWAAGRVQDFTGRVYQLTTEQMQGSAAVTNMNLEWFSAWIPGADGAYPTLNQTGAESDTSFWTGAAATEFAGGTGTKEDPFIIKTADQLYLALTKITATTSTTGDLAVETAESVTGGTQTDRILKQGSTDVYVPVYTPYYYKVADGVKAFYLNNVYGSETLAGAKAMATTTTKKDWKPGSKSFVGNLDGNGVTIYGMYSSTGQGLVYKLDGSSTVKNINFDSCYSSGTGNVALLTTNLGTYTNDTTIINILNISVRNSYMATTRNITLTARDDGTYQHSCGASGIVSSTNTAEALTISNCLYDGYSCERVIGTSSEATADMIGGIISGGHGMNNTVLNGCVSLGAPAVDEVYVSGKKIFYNRYDANLGFPVHFYECYSDAPLNITTAYPGEYDKLALINRVSKQDAYDKFDMPTLTWGSNWVLVTVGSRTIPMPTVNTADETLGSYATILGSEDKTGKYASVGPHRGTNPYTYTLKGSGTPEDPFIIETDIQLARAIATGGMNLYDRLYYRLGNDIDISGGLWINQTDILTASSTYTYTPFGGSLDGNGHVITGLSVGDTNSAGLIPVLTSTGEVKNLHLRDANVLSSAYAGAIAGEAQEGAKITGCSVEGASVESKQGASVIEGSNNATMDNVYYVTTDGTAYYKANGAEYDASNCANIFSAEANKANWYMGGKDGSTPKLKNLNSHANDLDIAGDGAADGYGANDLTALRNKLLRKPAYANINGDVSRNGSINISDLAVLQRTIVKDYGTKIDDSFFGNVEAGQIRIYYGENDNYDAARKVELYLESLFPGVDVIKCVSSSKGTVTGAESDSAKVYLHAGDEVGTPDGKLEIIVGNVDTYPAYTTNTVATATNTYAVTYDATKKVVWLQGANFTAVEQAAINFTEGCAVDGDKVYTVGSTVLAAEKQPIEVTLDKDFNGTPETKTVLYYAWGDEFEEDTINTYNWQFNNQQTEGTQGSGSAYNNLEMVPVRHLEEVLVVEGGRLSMKRAHDSKLNASDIANNTYNIVGSVALDVTPGEYNGYSQWTNGVNGENSIDTDGSDKYLTSGKIITERGMLFKQGYLEFQGQLPADGHAFPAWWLMGRPAQTQNNNGYDNSLYGKVYKLNSKWNGASAFDEDVLDTYKYQIPSAIYEIDMIEVMQHSNRHYGREGNEGIFATGSYHNDSYKTRKEAVYYYFINSTIHKWWNNGVDTQDTDDTSDDRLYIQDWDNYKVLGGGITNSAFSTTSTAGSWIHNIGSTELDFGTKIVETGNWLNKYTYYDTATYNDAAHENLTRTRKYGFSWNTDGESGFEATLYVYDFDGSVKTVPIASGMSTLNAFKDGNKNTEANGAIGDNAGVYSDAKVFNQYMYILFDNKYYSSNPNMDVSSDNTANMYTDLLTSTGLKSFEIDYIRVYQEDGARDIVTPATQAFNNSNHFGYK